jgi:DsbC/DsbD-like thiol-disulfide interchange protein
MRERVLIFPPLGATLLTILFVVCLLQEMPSYTLADQGDEVKVRLVMDGKPFKAGEQGRVGLHFSMQPGWHIYWKYSGQVGLPTAINLTFTKGVTGGELQWPTPQTFTSEVGSTYGYEHEVLIFTDVVVPASGDPSTSQITAQVSWLACDVSRCIPGKKMLLAMLDSSLPQVPELFSEAEKQVPAPQQSIPSRSTGGRGEPLEVMVTEGQGQVLRGQFSIGWEVPVSNVSWYPALPLCLGLKEIDVLSRDMTTEIRFGIEPRDGQCRIPRLIKTVLVYQRSPQQQEAANLMLWVMKNPSSYTGSR